jgi:hypothetical protein
LAPAAFISTRYNDSEKKTKKFDFEGGDPSKPPLQTFLAPAAFISTRYNDSEKKTKKFDFGEVTPLSPPNSPPQTFSVFFS